MSQPWTLSIGARPLPDGSVKFCVWAPSAQAAAVVIAGKESCAYPMEPAPEGYFETSIFGLEEECCYKYLLNGAMLRPDPASKWQPHGVHGYSRAAGRMHFPWTDNSWRGMDLENFILYELHIGTFTPEGTFESAIAKLSHLKELGITAVELMPIAQFPGERNWGYDGTYPFAVQASYGGPKGMKAFVNACHEMGIAVVLDVVYNHLGPEGNYLGNFGPYFTDRYKTPWGAAINFDGPYSDHVRRYFIDNALFWLDEYHVDALRLDAVHAIFDFGATHFLAELREAFHAFAETLKRKAWLIAESDLNDARVINPHAKGGFHIDAQWNDDFHHSLISYLANRSDTYFADFGTLADIAKSIKDGFVNDGRFSPYRKRRYGNSSKERPGGQFVIFVQNHDQIGNAWKGKRLDAVLSQEQVKLAACLLIFAPNLPMFFMGQEWGETTPFLYFTSHGDPDLIEAVIKGYAEEWGENPINPQDEGVFKSCILDWNKISQTPNKEHIEFFKCLISLRKQHPCLSNCRKDLTEVAYSEEGGWLTMLRKDPNGSEALLICNFSPKENPVQMDFPRGEWKPVFETAENPCGNPFTRPPWSACLYVRTCSKSSNSQI